MTYFILIIFNNCRFSCNFIKRITVCFINSICNSFEIKFSRRFITHIYRIISNDRDSYRFDIFCKVNSLFSSRNNFRFCKFPSSRQTIVIGISIPICKFSNRNILITRFTIIIKTFQWNLCNIFVYRFICFWFIWFEVIKIMLFFRSIICYRPFC